MKRRNFWFIALAIALPVALLVPLRAARSWQPRSVEIPFKSNAAIYTSDAKSFFWSPTGLLLARGFSDAWSEPRALTNWNGQTVPIKTLSASNAAFGESGRVAALINVSSNGEEELDIRDVPDGRSRRDVARRLGEQRSRRGLAFSALAIAPDGKRVAFNQLKPDSADVVGIADADSGQVTARVAHRKVELPNFKNPTANAAKTAQYFEVSALAFSPDGRQLAVVGINNVRIVDAQNGKVARSWNKPFDVTMDAVWSPNGRYLALSSGDKISAFSTKSGKAPFLWVHDVQTGKVLHSWVQKLNTMSRANGVTNLSWSPNGEILAFGTFDGQVLLMNIASGALEDRSDASASTSTNPEQFVAFAPDGRTLAVATQSKIMLWRVK